MAEIKLRDIQLTYNGRTLTISSLKQPARSVSLDPKSVEDLVDFVNLFAPVDDDSQPRSQNRREAFRVPIVDDGGFRFHILQNGRQFLVKATNISMTGIFIAVPDDSPLKIRIDDELETEMALEKWKIALSAVVRRQEDTGFGLFFPATIRGEHVEPPPVLRRIVMDLQRRWMLHSKHR